MANVSERIAQQSLTLDFSVVKELTSWPDHMVQDYIYKQQNIDIIARASGDLESQVETNTVNIQTNTDAITANTENISDNSDDIETNAENIATNATNLTNHESSTSAHGVTGDNVGTEDFAQSAIGGVVNLAVLVADAVSSATEITTADIGTAPVAYDQAYAQEQTDLINECKSTINALVTDTTSAINQLNALLLAEQNAKQMNTI